MGFFNNILPEEFVDYSLIFMTSRYSVGFSNIFVRIDGIMTEFVIVGGRLDERSINRRCHGTIAFDH